MKNGKCPDCGSADIYFSEYPFSESISVKSSTNSLEVFKTEAYLCLECRKLEMYVKENSAALFGKGKALQDSVPVSENWNNLQR